LAGSVRDVIGSFRIVFDARNACMHTRKQASRKASKQANKVV